MKNNALLTLSASLLRKLVVWCARALIPTYHVVAFERVSLLRLPRESVFRPVFLTKSDGKVEKDTVTLIA